MNSKPKIIAIIAATALGTTLFWAALIGLGLLFLSGQKVDHIEAKFLANADALCMFYGINSKTQSVVLVVEDLPMDTNATTGVELMRREVAPRQAVRIGIRELAQTKN